MAETRKTKYLNVRMTPATERRLRRLCKLAGCSKSRLLEDLLEQAELRAEQRTERA